MRIHYHKVFTATYIKTTFLILHKHYYTELYFDALRDVYYEMEPEIGLEPTTYRLQGDCSTN